MMALPAAPPLHPKRGIAVVPLQLKRRWGTSMFMLHSNCIDFDDHF